MTRNEDELARLREAFTAPVPAAWSAESCPEPGRIWEAVRGALPPDEVREIVDHVAVCASCAEDWRIAMAFEEESRAQQEKVATVRRFPSGERLRPWIAAAAAALVLTVGGVYLNQTRGPVGTPGYRGNENRIQSLAGESCPRNACVLSWSTVEGAESYDLLVTTSDLVTVADPKGLTTTRHQIPASALAGLPAGARLHWTVTAVFPDGGRVSKSFETLLE